MGEIRTASSAESSQSRHCDARYAKFANLEPTSRYLSPSRRETERRTSPRHLRPLPRRSLAPPQQQLLHRSQLPRCMRRDNNRQLKSPRDESSTALFRRNTGFIFLGSLAFDPSCRLALLLLLLLVLLVRLSLLFLYPRGSQEFPVSRWALFDEDSSLFSLLFFFFILKCRATSGIRCCSGSVKFLNHQTG